IARSRPWPPVVMNTGLQATSRLQFLSLKGEMLGSPQDWQPAFVEIFVAPEAWQSVRVERNGEPLPVSLQVIANQARVLAQWPRSGPGWYELRVVIDADSAAVRFPIKPAKISDAGLERL